MFWKGLLSLSLCWSVDTVRPAGWSLLMGLACVRGASVCVLLQVEDRVVRCWGHREAVYKRTPGPPGQEGRTGPRRTFVFTMSSCCPSVFLFHSHSFLSFSPLSLCVWRSVSFFFASGIIWHGIIAKLFMFWASCCADLHFFFQCTKHVQWCPAWKLENHESPKVLLVKALWLTYRTARLTLNQKWLIG